MNASFRDSKWLIVALLAAIGFGLLVLTIGSIDQRMSLPHGGQRQAEALVKNGNSSAPLDSPDGIEHSAATGDDVEPILDTDSVEVRIRKQYGMVKIAGVWLPASRIKSSTKTTGTAADATEAKPQIAVPLYITTGKLPEGTVGKSYLARIEAVGGMPPYAWSVERGPLAASLAFNPSSGELSGTPSAIDAKTVRIRVTDSAGAADIAEYQLKIIAVVHPKSTIEDSTLNSLAASPTPSDSSDPTDPEKPTMPLAIVTAALPEAKAAEPYTAAFTASGGAAPYAWSSLAALPAGLTLTPAGVLSGTPQEAGDFTLTIAVTDQSAQSAAQAFAFKVAAPVPDPVTQFTAFMSLRRIAFKWAAPADSTIASIRLLRNPLRPPADERDGIIIFDGRDTSAIDPSPPAGGSYYAAFAISADGIASAPAHLTAATDPKADPFADAVVTASLLSGAQAFNASKLPGIVLGSPRGGGISSGSTDVVSLGAAVADDGGPAPHGGSITLSFENNLAYDGPGADFTVFENVFYINGPTGPDPNTRMMEPAIVSVSQDGVTWHTFPFDFSPRYDAKTGALNLRHPFVYNKGFAGVNPVIASGTNVDPTDTTVSGGDSFDLADLRVPGLTWIRYIRLQSTGDKWMLDTDGELVRHPNTTAFKEATRTSTTSGFDLDAITAIWFGAVQGE